MGRRKRKENDVYSWSYKDGFGSTHDKYWCKSQTAIVKDGRLYDNFWSDERSPLDTKKVTIKFKGNLDEMTEIHRGDAIYYRWQDVVDMAHSNNSGAMIYIQPNAKRDKKTVLELIASRKEHYEQAIRSANRNLDDLKAQIENVENGNINDVWVPYI